MLRIGTVHLATPLLLAPIAGYCDLAFRHIVRRMTDRYPGAVPGAGVGLASTDLLCPEAVLRETEKSKWLAATDAEDRPLCMQLYGAPGDVMAEAARWAAANGATVIDINMGCPVDKVTKKNGGSKLLCDIQGTIALARKVVNAVRIPVTAKIRLGWDDGSLVHTTLPPRLADVGVAAITVHGRTTAQRFKGQVRLDGIAQTVEALAQFPDVAVIGNGDVRGAEDVRHMIDRTGCHGVMIGRGAIGRPWIFRDIAHHLVTGQHPPQPSRAQRIEVLVEHVDELVRLTGDESLAMLRLRKHLPRYSPGLQPWPGLRRSLHDLRSAEALRGFLARELERCRQNNAQPAA